MIIFRSIHVAVGDKISFVLWLNSIPVCVCVCVCVCVHVFSHSSVDGIDGASQSLEGH